MELFGINTNEKECSRNVPVRSVPSLETKLPLNYLNHARIEETKLMRSSIKHSFTQKRAFLAGKNITCAGLLQAASISLRIDVWEPCL